MSEAATPDGTRGQERPQEKPRALSVQVTWTPAALEALKALEASGLGLDAAGAKRKWNAALKKAARECVAKVRPRGAALKWAEQHEGATWSLDATFVCDEEMRELNARFRQKDRPTDVLSFSQAESAPIGLEDMDDLEPLNSEPGEVEAGAGEPLEIEWPGASGTGGLEASLGDLVIAVETAQRQASEREHTGEVEVLFLSIHGTLHLLGYDHQTSAQRVAMWREQEALFERLRATGKRK